MQAQTHQALRNSSLALLGTLAQEDALMLQLRGDEMERRWQVSYNSMHYSFFSRMFLILSSFFSMEWG